MASEKPDQQQVRLALLKYYSTECLTHGTYIITTFVAFVTMCAFLFPHLSRYRIGQYVGIGAILEGFGFCLFYIIGRTLWWAYLINGVLRVKPVAQKELVIEENEISTLLNQIHSGCSRWVKGRAKEGVRRMKIASFFSNARILIPRLTVIYILTVLMTIYFILILHV